MKQNNCTPWMSRLVKHQKTIKVSTFHLISRRSNRRGKLGGLAWKKSGMWEKVNEFPKTKRRKYPQYTSEWWCVIMCKANLSLIPAKDYSEFYFRLELRIITQPDSAVYWGYFRRLVFGNSLTKHIKLSSFSYSVVIFFLPISHVWLVPRGFADFQHRCLVNTGTLTLSSEAKIM